MVKKNNFSKKTDNKKTDNKKTDNKKTIVVVLICAIISTSALLMGFITFNPDIPELSENTIDSSPTMTDYVKILHDSLTTPIVFSPTYFDFYLTNDDYYRMTNDGLFPLDGVRLDFNDTIPETILTALEPIAGSIVIYPIFTSAAYAQPGFYDYFGGNCDESCITDISFEDPQFLYTSSGLTSQILYNAGYDFLTDIEVDQNPELLQNYDTVILLHNEYVTKKMFDAISGHPNLIFLAPNALYAEIDVNYDTNTMTLIRGHNYPDIEIANGFDYAIEEQFHQYEYDDECLDWEFIEIENGFHLNCYPDGIIHNNLDILIKMKDL